MIVVSFMFVVGAVFGLEWDHYVCFSGFTLIASELREKSGRPLLVAVVVVQRGNTSFVLVQRASTSPPILLLLVQSRNTRSTLSIFVPSGNTQTSLLPTLKLI